jgi:thioredoxin reductase (NADPH)
MLTDLVILGAGPAGLTAGIYAARARIPLLILEKAVPGGQMAATEMVDNYPGFSEPVYGFELAQKMEAHAKKFGAEIAYGEVNRVEPTPDGFALTTESGKTLTCRALIVATGASPVKLGIPGEKELAGKGVSYCAVCDGPFFRDVELAVIGGGDSAVEEAIYLTRFAKKVHVIHRRDTFRAVREIQEKAFSEPKIVVHWNTAPVAILGEKEVTGLRVRSVADGTEQDLPVGGVFFYVGLKPNAANLLELVKTDARGFIITDEKMGSSVPGVFAAGDVRCKVLRQISTAVGDGALAAYSAQQYLECLSKR